MELYFSPPSPFARKVMVAAYEYGLRDDISLSITAVTPVSDNPAVGSANPLAKVPTLILSDGSALFDSGVIVDFLQQRAGLPQPADNWAGATMHRAADGLMEAALLARYENALRPAELRWSDWTAGQLAKVERTLDWLERQPPAVMSQLSPASIASACALAYLDFRYADLRWRDRRPRLADFAEEVLGRRSLRLTEPDRDWSLADTETLAANGAL